MIKTCMICGKSFEDNNPRSRRQLCSKPCVRARKRETNKAYSIRTKAKQAGLEVPKEYEPARVIKKKEKKNPNQELVDMAIEARKAGMTYGRYVAHIYCGGLRYVEKG